MFTGDPPELVTLTASVLLLPVWTLPKPRLVGAALSAPADGAVPDNPIFKVGSDALLAIARLPVRVPLPWGAKLTLKLVLWPAVSVRGRLSPLIANADPVTVACEIVTLEPPELVSVPDRLLLLPACTVPKFRLAGLATIVPAETPVPESGRLSDEFDPLLAMAMPPVANPVAWGVKETVRLVLWPGDRFIGRAGPFRLKPFPVAVTCEIVTVEPPELVRVAELLWLVPIETLPKPMLDGAAVKEPVVVPVPLSGTDIVVPEYPLCLRHPA
jgi:hypothetical protein